MPRPRLLALPALLFALVLAACGGSSGAAGADPASVVPAGSALYFEGVVRPEDDKRDDVLDAARKILRTDDPERKLRELIDKGLKDEGKVTERSYSGVDYQVDGDGVAAGIVGDFFTVGTEAEFKRTIKAQDGDSLAEQKRHQRTIGKLDDDRIGQFYIDLKPFIAQALKSDPQAAQQLQQFRSIFPIDKLDPVSGALLADGDRIAFDSYTKGLGVKALKALGPLTGTGSTPLLGELPGDAWVAFGAADVGPAVKSIFTQVAGAFGGATATAQLQSQYGITSSATSSAGSATSRCSPATRRGRTSTARS